MQGGRDGRHVRVRVRGRTGEKLGEGEGRWGCTQGTAMSAVRAIYDRAGTDMKKARRRHR